MTTRELFAKHGATLKWGRHKVVLHIPPHGEKIVCSPAGFRWLRKLLEHYKSPDTEYDRPKREPEPKHEPDVECVFALPKPEPCPEVGEQPQYSE